MLDGGLKLNPVGMVRSAQIMRTLCNILEGLARFYLDLNNLIASHPAHDIIFIDFKQAGNWNTFQAPEIFYLEWM